MYIPVEERCELYVRRDTTNLKFWRLCWSSKDDTSFVYAEGECSAVYYRTMREAIAGGIKRFGKTAKKANW